MSSCRWSRKSCRVGGAPRSLTARCGVRTIYDAVPEAESSRATGPIASRLNVCCWEPLVEPQQATPGPHGGCSAHPCSMEEVLVVESSSLLEEELHITRHATGPKLRSLPSRSADSRAVVEPPEQ